MLFEDYDLQMRIAHKAISTVADSSSVLIPTLQPLSTGSRSFLSQKIENLRSDSSNDLDRGEKLAARSRAAYLQESEITGSLWVEEDPELAKLKSRLQANASINVPALERMEEKVALLSAK